MHALGLRDFNLEGWVFHNLLPKEAGRRGCESSYGIEKMLTCAL